MTCSLNTILPARVSLDSSAKTADISAEAYQGLEPLVNDAFNAGAVFEMVMDNVLGTSKPTDGLHTFIVSHEDWNTLFYAMYQLTNLSRDMKAQYYAAFEPPTPKH